jgi:hypothetical protein
MRQIFLAGKEAQERPALLRDLVADGAAQHRIAGLERVENGPLRDRAFDFEFYLVANRRQRSQMVREYDSDHVSSIYQRESRQRLHLNRKYGRKVSHNRRPAVSRIGGGIDLAAAGAEIDAALVERIDGHRIA